MKLNNNKFKKLSLVLTIGTLGVISPVVAIVSINAAQKNNAISISSANLSKNGNEDASLNNYANHSTLYELNLEGFAKLALDALPHLEKDNIHYNLEQITGWYLTNTKKALNLIAQANASLKHRSFWSGIASVFKIVGGEIASFFTAGQVKEVEDFRKESHQEFNRNLEDVIVGGTEALGIVSGVLQLPKDGGASLGDAIGTSSISWT